MAYTEEPQSELEKIIGRRFPLAVIILVALCWAAYMKMDQLTTILGVVIAAIGVTYYQSVGIEKQNAQVLKQEAATEVKNG